MDNSEIPEPSSEMIALYKQYVPEYLANLKAAVTDQDQQQMDFQCHKMCSAMRTMGFDNIAVILERIKDNDVTGETVAELTGQVEIMINHTLVLLNKS